MQCVLLLCLNVCVLLTQCIYLSITLPGGWYLFQHGWLFTGSSCLFTNLEGSPTEFTWLCMLSVLCIQNDKGTHYSGLMGVHVQVNWLILSWILSKLFTELMLLENNPIYSNKVENCKRSNMETVKKND